MSVVFEDEDKEAIDRIRREFSDGRKNRKPINYPDFHRKHTFLTGIQIRIRICEDEFKKLNHLIRKSANAGNFERLNQEP